MRAHDPILRRVVIMKVSTLSIFSIPTSFSLLSLIASVIAIFIPIFILAIRLVVLLRLRTRSVHGAAHFSRVVNVYRDAFSVGVHFVKVAGVAKIFIMITTTAWEFS